MTDGARRLVARYSGRCFCGLTIAVGDAIAWERGSSAAHWDCHVGVLARLPAAGTASEAARGVGELACDTWRETVPCDPELCEGVGEGGIDERCGYHFDSPRHPENAEHVLMLEETDRTDELDHWYSHFTCERSAA